MVGEAAGWVFLESGVGLLVEVDGVIRRHEALRGDQQHPEHVTCP